MNEWDEFPLATADEARKPPGAGPKLANPEMSYLNSLRDQSSGAANALKQYQRAAEVFQRSGMNPDRAAQIQASIVPEDGDLFDLAGAKFWRWISGVSDQEISDFQFLQGLQSAQVLDRQIEQKGPQTESDAARLKLTEISPFKTRAANAALLRDGMSRVDLLTEKAPFFVSWANKHGLNGLDERGRSVDAAWGEEVEAQSRLMGLQTDLRRAGMPGLSAEDLREYRRLAEGGADAGALETFILNATGGRGRLANAGDITAARDAGAGLNTRVELQGFSIERVK